MSAARFFIKKLLMIFLCCNLLYSGMAVASGYEPLGPQPVSRTKLACLLFVTGGGLAAVAGGVTYGITKFLDNLDSIIHPARESDSQKTDEEWFLTFNRADTEYQPTSTSIEVQTAWDSLTPLNQLVVEELHRTEDQGAYAAELTWYQSVSQKLCGLHLGQGVPLRICVHKTTEYVQNLNGEEQQAFGDFLNSLKTGVFSGLEEWDLFDFWSFSNRKLTLNYNGTAYYQMP